MMTRTRMRWAGLATAGAAAVAVTAAGLSGGAAASTARTTLVLTSKPGTSTLFIPCPTCVKFAVPKGAHIGGEEIDAGPLLRAGTKVGHYALASVGMTPFTAAHPGELLLTAVMVINGSQLVAQGLEEPPDRGGTAAIIGGTGAYRGARGLVRYSDNADGSTTLRISLNS